MLLVLGFLQVVLVLPWSGSDCLGSTVSLEPCRESLPFDFTDSSLHLDHSRESLFMTLWNSSYGYDVDWPFGPPRGDLVVRCHGEQLLQLAVFLLAGTGAVLSSLVYVGLAVAAALVLITALASWRIRWGLVKCFHVLFWGTVRLLLLGSLRCLFVSFKLFGFLRKVRGKFRGFLRQSERNRQGPRPARWVGRRRVCGPRYGWSRRFRLRRSGLGASPFPLQRFGQRIFDKLQFVQRQQWCLGYQLRGGAGGAAATRRKRKEVLFLEELSALIQKFSPQQPETPCGYDVSEDAKTSTLCGKVRHVLDQKLRFQELLAALGTVLNEAASSSFADGHGEGLKQSFYTGQVGPRKSNSSVSPEHVPLDSTNEIGKGKGVRRVTTQPPRTSEHKEGKGTSVLGSKKTSLSRKTLDRPQNAAFLWAPQEFVPSGTLLKQLEQGEEPTGKVCFTKASDAKLLQRLASEHETKGQVTLVLTDSVEKEALPDKAVERQYDFDKRGLKKAFVAPLNPKTTFEPKQSKVLVHKLSTPVRSPAETRALRVTFVRIFEEDREWQRLVRQPHKGLAEVLQGRSAWSYGWKVVSGDGEPSAIVGFLKVKEDLATELLQLSGTNGLFFEALSGALGDRPPVTWVRKAKDEGILAYFERSRGQAVDAKVPLTFRRGGGSCFGLRGKVDSQAFASFVVTGFPSFFCPQDVKDFLEGNGWVLKDNISPPRTKKQGWLIGASHPTLDREAVHVYEVPDGDEQTLSITIKRWRRTPKDGGDRPLKQSSGWVPSHVAKTNPDPVNIPVPEDMEDVGSPKALTPPKTKLLRWRRILRLLGKVRREVLLRWGPLPPKRSQKVLATTTIFYLSRISKFLTSGAVGIAGGGH